MEDSKINNVLSNETFEDIQPSIIRMVNYYVNSKINSYRVVTDHNYDKDDVIFEVYNGLYNKKNENEPCTLEKAFNKAKEDNLNMDYLLHYIGRAVSLKLLTIQRDNRKKPFHTSLDQKVGEDDTIANFIVTKNNEYSLVELENSIPNMDIPGYSIEFNGKSYKLSTRVIFKLISYGYSKKEISDMVKSDTGCIKSSLRSKLVGEVSTALKYSLKDYVLKGLE